MGNVAEKIRVRKHEESAIPYLGKDEISLLGNVFGFLNSKDKDILFLIFVSRKKQKDVQAITGRSQPSLCYDIKRIRKRLKFIFYLQPMLDRYAEYLAGREAGDDRFKEDETAVMTLMLYTSSYTLAAKLLGKSQVNVRYVFRRCLKKLKSLKMWPLYELYSIICGNLNIVRREYKGNKARVIVKKT